MLMATEACLGKPNNQESLKSFLQTVIPGWSSMQNGAHYKPSLSCFGEMLSLRCRDGFTHCPFLTGPFIFISPVQAKEHSSMKTWLRIAIMMKGFGRARTTLRTPYATTISTAASSRLILEHTMGTWFHGYVFTPVKCWRNAYAVEALGHRQIV